MQNPVYAMQSKASPIHLSGSLLLFPGSSGSVPPAALKNPMGQDMELLEVKFELSLVTAITGAENIPAGASIWCELMMGGNKLTNGAIPVWNYGRAENIEGEYKRDTTSGREFLAYSWRLPRPLFIPAGAVVIPKFTHTGLFPGAISVRIGYSARTVFTKPKVVYMPWVAKYVSKAFNPITAAGTDASSELDLVNPHPEVLHLQRFTGRLYTSRGTTAAGPSTADIAPEIGGLYLFARMSDSYGRPIVRSYTPFQSVFEGVGQSWEMDGATLDPEAFFVVNLRKDALSTTVYPSAQTQAFVSMVGWRELELA